MDIVITYVNSSDPIWQNDYRKYSGKPFVKKRFRDWGTLKYLFRGIEANLPFAKNVYLVVSGPSQIPTWLDTGKVHVIYHEDIIPAEFLPTFNSATIEMFLHNIRGLDEEFLYLNDDMFPMLPSQETDFFLNGMSILGFKKRIFCFGLYRKILRNSDRTATEALSGKRSMKYLKPQHTCSPLTRSRCKKVYWKMENEITASLTRTRSGKNLSQYLFLDYLFYDGMMINKRISNHHFTTALHSSKKVHDFILFPETQFICINDVDMSEKKYMKSKENIIKAFETKFRKKSEYERKEEEYALTNIR